ncbi:MAG TPA: TetR family transcriptional regulator [Gammaproteobacteria bacterium]|nr:TetR family transcriptional regulator [Gammaproteobacteria bacterium]
MSKEALQSSNSAGRPHRSHNPAVRARLLDAARGLFAQHGFSAVSTRAVAESAGANPAMIHYYFGSKQGLYEAMIADTFTPLFEHLGTLLAPDSPQPIRRFFDAYMRALGANPWMPPLILREVVAENGKLRQWFIQQFATRGGGLLTRLVQTEQAAGRIRADLDPTLTALSMVSLAVFPFVAMPLASAVFGVRIKPDYLDILITHTERLFRQGVSP